MTASEIKSDSMTSQPYTTKILLLTLLSLNKSNENNASVCLDHILSRSHSFGFAHTNLRVYLSPHHLCSPPSREETGRRAITLTTLLIGYMWVIANCCTPLTTSRALYTQNVHDRGSVGERSNPSTPTAESPNATS